MAGFDPVLDLLPRAPLAGLDVDAVQKERKDYWERLYQKYEKSSELDQEDISVHDLDKPDTMKRFRGLQCELPTTKAFRRYIAQHGGLLDELTTMAGPPALDEEELSSEDDSDEEGEGQGDNDYSDEGEVNVGLGGLVMREKDSEEGNQKVILRKNGGKRSSEEHLSGEAETEEEEDFSSPPAKVVTPSKTRVIVEYYTSEDEAEAGNMDPPSGITAEARRLYDEGEEENSLICSNCGALGDVLEEGGAQSEFRCDECLMKVHPECEDYDCSVCREVAAVVEARWILRNQLTPLSGESGEEEWVTGAEGDFATQSSDDTDQENDQYEERAGWGEEEQNSSGSEEPAKGELDITEEGEVFGETFGTGPESEADTTGNGNVLWEDSRDYSTDEGQEGDSSKEGQDMEGGNLGDLPGSPGMVGDTFGDMLERGELPQDSSREMANRGRCREMSWEEGEEEEDCTEEEDNCSSVSMSTVF